MITTIRIDTKDLFEELADLQDDLCNRILCLAAEAGGQVVETAYRNALLQRKTTSGTYKSAQGEIEHFIQAYESVGHRTLLFRDRTGAYSVVGIIAAEGNWRSQSPQAMWLEWGTEERTRKSDGQKTGQEVARHTLENIVNQIGDTVISTMQNIISTELAKYVV